MYKLIAIIGKSGTGKDTLLKRILSINPNFHKVVCCTTRPKREGEVDGVDYHFLNPQDFRSKVLSFDMVEVTSFNDWFYGTSKEDLCENKVNIGIFNPEAVEMLKEYSEIYLEIFYLVADDKIRLTRQLNREENPNVDEIVRRYLADKKDFDNWTLGEAIFEHRNNNLDDFQQILLNFMPTKNNG